MNNILKIVAYCIGGLALVVGSFVTFSAMTGTPMHEMKAVGAMFPENVEAEIETDADSTMLPDPEAELEADLRSPRQVLETAASPLGAFAFPDPYSSGELRDIERTLLTKLDEVARRAARLEARERQLEEDRQHLADLYEEFEKLKTSLVNQSDDNRAVRDEIQRDRSVLEERRIATYSQMAKLFEGTKATEAARLLTNVYAPEEAARILVQLDDDRVTELIGAIATILPDDAPRYVRALENLHAELGEG
jgi:flagellar motility protein MotE (MotC chaperone)